MNVLQRRGFLSVLFEVFLRFGIFLEKFFKVITLRLQDQISTQLFIRSGIVEVLKGSGTPSLF